MTAFFFCEIILSFSIFHFPQYKHTEQYQCVEDPAIIIKKYPSGYENINGESGAFIKYNDVGLPGIYTRHRKKIAICGSSFIMGQLSADYLASSLVQKSLDSLQKDISIINLGEGNYGPYRSFHRVEFYNKSFDFDYVIYINDGNWEKQALEAKSFSKQNSFTYKLVEWERSKKIINNARSISRFVNITTIALNNKFGRGFLRETGESDDFNFSEKPGYRMSFNNFRNLYNNKFIVINIGDDVKFNEELQKICREMTIPYFYKNLMNPQNRFNMYGHFNKRGNLELARYIINVLKCEEII